MFDLLMIGLLQAAAGEPQTPAPAEAAPQAQAQTPEQSAPASGAEDDGERLVCRRVPRIGTRFTDRVCTTRREDDRRRADDRQALERAQAMRWKSN